VLPVALATVPVSGVFFPDRVFHIRDLSLFFWGRYLWLRHSLFAGGWPLWDPWMGAGQSAVADALNQMFLLPVVALRLLGTEAVGFNLWVAAPFPLAGLGAYLYFRGRFSRSASALGATAFAICGPVISTGNFPNLSWSVATMPWVMWAVDRLLASRRPADLALVAVTFTFQALAGEPVSLTATGALAFVYAAWVGSPGGETGWLERTRGAARVAAGLALGFAGAAIQLLPLAEAVRDSWRPYGVGKDFWSLHPLGLAEMFSPHLFGDYFASTNFLALPWMPPLNSGRDPFFFSIYFGTALVALATFGAAAGWRRRWSGFWVAAGAVALAAAFGTYTPFYRFLQAHVPLIASFRFPVKFLLVLALALAGLAAAGWDALLGPDRRAAAAGRYRAAQVSGVAFPVLIAAMTYVLSGLCLYFPETAARAFFRLAADVGVSNPAAGASYMLKSLPESSTEVMLLALGGALFLAVASARRRETRLAQVALYVLIGVDLSVAAWGINPTFDARYFRQPDWIGATRGDDQGRFYFGGKFDGTLIEHDLDGPRTFVRPFDMSPVDGRGALSVQLAFIPGAWHAREMLSYDLAVLWPRTFDLAVARFRQDGRDARDRFLWRTGVRYRVLPTGIGGNRPSTSITYFTDIRLFDWGPAFPRVYIVPQATTIPDVRRQIDELFGSSFDPAQTVMLTAPAPQAFGREGPAAEVCARIVDDRANGVTVEAGVPQGGGYLLLLDSFAPGWRVTVDGTAATVLRANALFRAVRLTPGRHLVVFHYRPLSFLVGAGVSAASGLAMLMLWAFGRRKAAWRNSSQVPT
jgi:hypothetical protein